MGRSETPKCITFPENSEFRWWFRPSTRRSQKWDEHQLQGSVMWLPWDHPTEMPTSTRSEHRQCAHRGREEWVKRTRRRKERAWGGGGLWFDIQGSPLRQPWGKSQRAESLAPRALPWERENASMGRLCNLQEIWTARFSLEQMPRGRWIIQCAAMCHSENQDEEKCF